MDALFKKLWEDWRSQGSLLCQQQVFLIDNSLRCNVALGEEELKIDDARLRETLRQARLTELVEQLPQGADTILGSVVCVYLEDNDNGSPSPGPFIMGVVYW